MAKRRRKPDPEAIHKITYYGVYYGLGNSGGARQELPFEIELKVQQKHLENSNPLSVFLNHLAPQYMLLKYPDYSGLAKYDVKHSEAADGVLELSLMSREQLAEYIEEEDLYVYPQIYRTDEQLREAIRENEKDPEAFKLSQDRQQALYGDEYVKKTELADLNADLFPTKGGVATAPPLTDLDDGPPRLVKPSDNPVPTKDLVGTSDGEDAPIDAVDSNLTPQQKAAITRAKNKATAEGGDDDLDV